MSIDPIVNLPLAWQQQLAWWKTPLSPDALPQGTTLLPYSGIGLTKTDEQIEAAIQPAPATFSQTASPLNYPASLFSVYDARNPSEPSNPLSSPAKPVPATNAFSAPGPATPSLNASSAGPLTTSSALSTASSAPSGVLANPSALATPAKTVPSNAAISALPESFWPTNDVLQAQSPLYRSSSAATAGVLTPQPKPMSTAQEYTATPMPLPGFSSESALAFAHRLDGLNPFVGSGMPASTPFSQAAPSTDDTLNLSNSSAQQRFSEHPPTTFYQPKEKTAGETAERHDMDSLLSPLIWTDPIPRDDYLIG